jgi:peptidoglycan biosynthesis protein MviN/MurJ (putative lipid II flippase)
VNYPVDRVGDVAAAGSVTAASVSWMTQANEIISLVAGLIAIAAGCFAIAVHFKNLRKP